MNDKKIRVRFAPSPTGFLHVGSLRTALYNYLFARRHQGTFVLRIEDTDQVRITPGAVDNLLSTLSWAGLDYDEGPVKGGPCEPYFQSQRLDIYKKYAEQLLLRGHAYRCFCSAARLEKIRARQLENKQTPKYDGKCRSLSTQESERLSLRESFVLRMKIPASGQTSVPDLIRGDVHFQNELLDDQILLKSDGFPTYHLANVIDDHLMQISHVIRGEEWLLSTPKHILLYDYFNWTPPQFAHLPLLLNPDRSKLSKRQGDVAVEDYIAQGYLPQALLNFVALLGWNRGDDQEIFTLSELVSSFSLDRVSKSGAIFNQDKLNWMNGSYIRSMNNEEYVRRVQTELKNAGFQTGDDHKTRQIALAIRNSLSTFAEVSRRADLFCNEKIAEYQPEAKQWIRMENSQKIFTILIEELQTVPDITVDSFKEIIKRVQAKTGIKGKDLWLPIRSAITGVAEGPDLPLVIEILGKKKMIRFLEQAKIQANKQD
jgi:nondiscriminating glutamyl-tRNA synthetase